MTPARIDLARCPDFDLGGLRVRPSSREVVVGGRREQLEPRVMQLLTLMGRRPGEVISRDELIECCWEGRIVGEDAINRAISKLRRLSELDTGASFTLETIPRVGYRLWPAESAAGTPPDGGEPPAPAGAADRPATGPARRRIALRPKALAVAGLAVVAAVLLGAWFLFGEQRVSASGEKPALVVLPFKDLSQGRDQAYFAEGVAEEIQGVLAGQSAIKVIGRTSSRHFQDETDLGEIRRALHVSHVLEGSIRRSGEVVRLNVRLVRASDGAQVFARQYDRPTGDMFAVQDEIGALVAAELGGALARRTARRQPTAEAHDLVLAARARLRERRPADITSAVETLQRAVAVDPAYGPAWGELATATLLSADTMYGYGRTPARTAREDARRFAERAVALAPNHPAGHAALGQLAAEPAAAIAHLRKAVALDPSRADWRTLLAQRLETVGEYEGALRQLRAAAEVDPLYFGSLMSLAMLEGWLGRYDQAAATIARVEALPNRGQEAAVARGYLALERGDWSEVVRLFEAAHRRPGGLRRPDPLGRTYRILGLRDRAAALVALTNRPFEAAIYARDDRRALQLLDAGEPVWEDSTRAWMAADLLVRNGRSRQLVAVYDQRFGSMAEYCRRGGDGSALSLVTALQQTGRAADARTVIVCAERVAAKAYAAGFQKPLNGFELAAFAALDGRRDEALARLERAWADGFRGQQFTADPDETLDFRSLRNEPRYQAVRAKLLNYVEAERRQVANAAAGQGGVVSGRSEPSVKGLGTVIAHRGKRYERTAIGIGQGSGERVTGQQARGAGGLRLHARPLRGEGA